MVYLMIGERIIDRNAINAVEIKQWNILGMPKSQTPLIQMRIPTRKND